MRRGHREEMGGFGAWEEKEASGLGTNEIAKDSWGGCGRKSGSRAAALQKKKHSKMTEI